MVEIVVNESAYQAQKEETVFQVLRRNGIPIPFLCYHEALSPFGSCRLCMVEVIKGGRKGLTTSCTLPVSNDLEIKTDTSEIVRVRKILLELYLAEAPRSERVRELARQYGVESTRFTKIDRAAKGDRCVLCGLCVRVCSEVLGVGAIHYAGRGKKTSINTPWYETSSACIGCGACAYVCPADAIDIVDKDGTRTMETWHETAVKLRECAESGSYFASEKLLQYICGKNVELPSELKDLSPESRKKKVAADFALKASRG